MKVTIEFDPTKPDELAAVRALVDLPPPAVPATPAPATPSTTAGD